MKRAVAGVLALYALGFTTPSIARTPGSAIAQRTAEYQSFGEPPGTRRESSKGKDARFLRIVTFNIMAATWTEPGKYAPIPASVVDRGQRIQRVIAVLKAAESRGVDIIALQEVNLREFKILRSALGEGFRSQMASNLFGYWASEGDLPDPEKWEPNGPAIFARKSAFSEEGEPEFSQHALGDAGNFSIAMKARHRRSDRIVRFFSVHLDDTPTQPDDDDVTMMGRQETLALMRLVGPERQDVTDVIAGDLNINLGPRSPLRPIFEASGFVNVVDELNPSGRPYATSPYRESDQGPSMVDIYDHVLVRNAAPIFALVRHFGAEEIADEDRRAEAFMRAAGSDHYPLEAVIEIR